MKRTSLPFLVVSALAVATISTTGCTGNRGGKKTDEVAASETPGGPAGKVITMDDVDDKLNGKVQGERFRVTYNADDPYKGADSPLVTIVEFSDFQCPFCTKFTDMLNEVIKDPAYAKDVRVVFKQFPLPMHKDAGTGSEAALASKRSSRARLPRPRLTPASPRSPAGSPPGKRRFELRAPRAAVSSLPCSGVSRTTSRSDSPSGRVRSTTAGTVSAPLSTAALRRRSPAAASPARNKRGGRGCRPPW